MTRVLLINPDMTTAETFAATLEPYQIVCTHSTGSKQAVRALESDYSIDAIIVQIHHGSCGLAEVLKAIRENSRYQYIPVIMTCSECSANIVVESLRQGASDVLTLPTPEEQIARRIQAAVAKGKRRILVVDDEQVIRDYLKDLLNMERFIPIMAASATEALEILKTTSVHAVVSDIMMPGMSGMELLVQLKSNYPAVPVILITGYGGRFTPQEAMGAGADGYFLKPFKNVELIRTLRGVLTTSAAVRKSATASVRR